MRGRLEVAVVFCAALMALGWRAGVPGIATAYVDPVAKIQAQDEAVYGSTIFDMAAHGDWVTPRFLGRYALHKPPLLYWLSAPCVRVLGRTAMALRLPSVVAGAATVSLVFWWLRAAMPLATALTGALLLLSSHMFFVISRTGLTDALLTLEMVVAMAALARDPRLETRSAAAGFGCATGLAVMTKAVAGIFPLLVLGVCCLVSKDRPRRPRLAFVLAIAAAVSLPWHIWQLAVHPRWFWTEYVLTEHVAKGLGAPGQTTQESQVLYYVNRLALLDPLLLAGALAASFRVRSRVLWAWIAVVFASAIAFHYRNTSYILPLFPAMAILAASAIPRKWAPAALAAAAALFIVKVLAPHASWGVPFRPESVNSSYTALDAYAARHRANDLILIDPDDQFYSSDLRLAHVRYCFIDPPARRPRNPLDFEYLGITVTAPEFNRIGELTPMFAERLRQWDLNSTEPIATVILANRDEIANLILSHPESDFYLSPEWSAADSGVHDLWHPTGPRVFLLSRVKAGYSKSRSSGISQAGFSVFRIPSFTSRRPSAAVAAYALRVRGSSSQTYGTPIAR